MAAEVEQVGADHDRLVEFLVVVRHFSPFGVAGIGPFSPAAVRNLSLAQSDMVRCSREADSWIAVFSAGVTRTFTTSLSTALPSLVLLLPV